MEDKALEALEAKQAEDKNDGTNRNDDQDTGGDDNSQGAKDDGADAGKTPEPGDAKGSDDDADAKASDTGDDSDSDDSQFDPEDLPDRAKYIYDNLPTLRARGSLGDGKVRDYSIKTAQELPDKFEFASKRDELLFVQELADQAQRATALDTTWQQQEQKSKYDTWQQQQAKDIASDLADLQKENLVPKFTEKDARDNPDDVGVKLANDIYDYMQKTNTARANAGKPYFLSYRDAAEIVLAKKGLENKSQNNNKIQQERNKVAAEVSSGQGTSREVKRPTKFNSVWDIVDRHEQDLN